METRCVLKVYFRGREQMFLPNTASSKLSLSDETKHITFKINLSILSSSLCSFLNAKLAVLNILKVESIKFKKKKTFLPVLHPNAGLTPMVSFYTLRGVHKPFRLQ